MILDTFSVGATLIVIALSIVVVVLIKHTYTQKKPNDE